MHRAFAGYKGDCDCGWLGQLRQWPWEAETDEADHIKTCAIINLDLRSTTKGR